MMKKLILTRRIIIFTVINLVLLTAEKINAIPNAKFMSEVTVKIERESSTNSEIFPSGTGFLVAKIGNSYFVATVAHNLDTNRDGKIDNKDNIIKEYIVITNDKKRHKVNGYQYLITKTLSQLDLAVIRFEDSKDYTVVDIEKSFDINPFSFTIENFTDAIAIDKELTKIGNKLYVPGFSQSAIGLRVDECQIIEIQKPQDTTTRKPVEPVEEDNTRFPHGYDLNCDISPDVAKLDGGMSGSPMFSEDGRIVAIFGRSPVYNKKLKKGILINIFLEAINFQNDQNKKTLTNEENCVNFLCLSIPNKSSTSSGTTQVREIPNTINKSLSNNIILEKYGELKRGDKVLSTDNSLYDEYFFEGKEGQTLIIKYESKELNAYVAIFSPTGDFLDERDDKKATNFNSEIQITLSTNGTYRVLVNAYDKDSKGKYILRVINKD